MAEVRCTTGEGDEGWCDHADLHSRFMQEAIPGERPTPVELLQAGARDLPAHMRTARLVATEGGRTVGAGAVTVSDLRRTAGMWFLYVVPEHRRRGLGSAMLAEARRFVAAGGERGYSRLRTSTPAGARPGEAFVEWAGGERGLVSDQQRCPVASLDADQLQAWRARAGERAAGYSLVAFDGVCPEEHLDAFTAAIPIMNSQPHTADVEDVVPTRDEVRENMAGFVRQGNTSWTVCVRDDSTGAYVGYTELSFSAYRPWRAQQGDTGIHPDHRERGLGRWLKATTALRLLAERPEVEYIETWNASANAPMLSINRAMGFEVVARWQQWSLPVEP